MPSPRKHSVRKLPKGFAPEDFTGAETLLQISKQISPPSQNIYEARDKIVPGISENIINSVLTTLTADPLGYTQEERRAFEDFTKSGIITENISKNIELCMTTLSYMNQIGGIYDENGNTVRRVIRFNVDETTGADNVKGIRGYRARALPLTASENDIIILPDDISPEVIRLLSKAKKKASLPEGNIMKESDFRKNWMQIVTDPKNMYLEFFKTPLGLYPSQLELQTELEDKDFSLSYLSENGIPIPTTYFSSQISEALRHVNGKPIVLKEIVSVGGMGVIITSDPEEISAFIREKMGKVQIQEYIEGTECSMQFFHSVYGSARIDCTDQIVKKYEHQGNMTLSRAISPEDSQRLQNAGNALQKLGYLGEAAIDAIKDRNGDLRLIEVNPRLGGTTAPRRVRHLLGQSHESWFSNYYFPNMRELENAIDKHGYSQENPSGFFVYAIMPFEDDTVKAQIQYFLEREKIAAQLEKLEKINSES